MRRDLCVMTPFSIELQYKTRRTWFVVTLSPIFDLSFGTKPEFLGTCPIFWGDHPSERSFLQSTGPDILLKLLKKIAEFLRVTMVQPLFIVQKAHRLGMS